ncbi:MAG: phosphohistidine phosphatase SixA, partial [Candidatus Obscuribacterales bacterium]|nr:phosphohistidine phosphatase SixA [Candidatus Obscuribacterales bacterium]
PVEGLTSEIRHDGQRPLSEQGIIETNMMGSALKTLGCKPNPIISSPLVRACQTADIFKEHLGGDHKITGCLAPGGGPEEVFDYLEKYEDNDEVMLIGHEPDIGEIVAELVGGSKQFCMPFKKTAVCLVEVADMPPVLAGSIVWLLTPSIIRALFQES